MEKTYEALAQQCEIILAERDKRPSKAGHARIRKATLEIAKIGKAYRRLSLIEDKKKD